MDSNNDNLDPIKSDPTETKDEDLENLLTKLNVPPANDNTSVKITTSKYTYTKEDEKKADRIAIIAVLLFFGGPLLYLLLLKMQSNSEIITAIVQNSLVSLVLTGAPLVALFILIINKIQYPWHTITSLLLGIFLMIIVAIIVLIGYVIVAIVSVLGGLLSCCSGLALIG